MRKSWATMGKQLLAHNRQGPMVLGQEEHNLSGGAGMKINEKVIESGKVSRGNVASQCSLLTIVRPQRRCKLLIEAIGRLQSMAARRSRHGIRKTQDKYIPRRPHMLYGARKTEGTPSLCQ